MTRKGDMQMALGWI